MERDALIERIRGRAAAMLAGGAIEEVELALERGASRTARKALGFKEIAAHLQGDLSLEETRERIERGHIAYVKRQLTWMKKLAGVAVIDRTGPRPTAAEAAARIPGESLRLPRPCGSRSGRRSATTTSSSSATTSRSSSRPERVRRMCAAHFGAHSDGVLLLSPPSDPRFVASLRIFNPDGSEAELSGNGVREAILYLRRHGWTDADEFSIETAAGEVRPTITSATTCSVEMGRARLTSRRLSLGRRGRPRHGARGRPRVRLPVREHRQPAVRDPGRRRARGARPGPHRPADRGQRAVSEPHQRVVHPARRSGDRVRARIFERGVGETLASGTGASGAAVTAVLRGATSPVIVELDGGELEVAVSDDLDVTLTGWAEPVYRGEFADEFVRSLEEAE